MKKETKNSDTGTDQYRAQELRAGSFHKTQPLGPGSKRKRIKWPSSHPSAESMSEAGFYFDPLSSSQDNATCFDCGVHLDGWEPHDIPILEHIKSSPFCLWANIVASLQRDGQSRTSATPSVAASGSYTCLLDNPQGADSHALRVQSFDGWPQDYDGPSIGQLASAGFFYNCQDPHDDTASCMYCGTTLGGWEPGDDPNFEHQKRRPDCYYYTFKPKSSRNDTSSGLEIPSSIPVDASIIESPVLKRPIQSQSNSVDSPGFKVVSRSRPIQDDESCDSSDSNKSEGSSQLETDAVSFRKSATHNTENDEFAASVPISSPLSSLVEPEVVVIEDTTRDKATTVLEDKDYMDVDESNQTSIIQATESSPKDSTAIGVSETPQKSLTENTSRSQRDPESPSIIYSNSPEPIEGTMDPATDVLSSSSDDVSVHTDRPIDQLEDGQVLESDGQSTAIDEHDVVSDGPSIAIDERLIESSGPPIVIDGHVMDDQSMAHEGPITNKPESNDTEVENDGGSSISIDEPSEQINDEQAIDNDEPIIDKIPETTGGNQNIDVNPTEPQPLKEESLKDKEDSIQYQQTPIEADIESSTPKHTHENTAPIEPATENSTGESPTRGQQPDESQKAAGPSISRLLDERNQLRSQLEELQMKQTAQDASKPTVSQETKSEQSNTSSSAPSSGQLMEKSSVSPHIEAIFSILNQVSASKIRHISDIPENQLDMTVEQWVKFRSQTVYDDLITNCERMLKVFERAGKLAISSLENE